VIRLAVAAVAAAALVAGCGGGTHGSATLWVTRDEGRTVVLDTTVPAGETALQALDRKTDVSTRYGGKFVESVNGVAGSITQRSDWFYFVNGIEAPRGAQEYRLRDGDVLWWDYRNWGRFGETVSAVVGAFPEPFVHGYAGSTRPTIVLGPRTAVVRRIARLVHATRIAPAASVRVPAGTNTLTIVPGPRTRFSAEAAGRAVHFTYAGAPERLLDPALYRHRYRIP
jgi:uncharacterized protein DUF4430